MLSVESGSLNINRTISTIITHQSDLQHLEMSYCLSKLDPPTRYDFLSHLPALQFLSLRGFPLAPDSLGYCGSNVTRIQLSNNGLSGHEIAGNLSFIAESHKDGGESGNVVVNLNDNDFDDREIRVLDVRSLSICIIEH